MNKIPYLSGIFIVALLLGTSGIAVPMTPEQKEAEANKIRSACAFAWNGYMKYARGYDQLKPVSLKGENWYRTSFLMTPLDAFDTFILMGLTEETAEAKELVLGRLNFDVDQDVQVFEINIRLLAGLISAFGLDGDKRFLGLAEDLGKRLLPAFRTETGMPYRYVNLKTGAIRDSLNNPAEIGTCLLEFGMLTRLTGDSVYYKTAKKAVFQVYRRRSDNDLVGTVINVTTGEWTNRETRIGARIDSYYEYLFKAWLLFGDRECYDAWKIHNAAIKKFLLKDTPHGSYFTRADMTSGKETHPYYGALDAFYAGILALSGDTATASKVQEGNFYMWTHFNLEPEVFNFRTGKLVVPSYPLRPENLESCFYLYRATGKDRYLEMGKRMIGDILDKCRTEAGFAALKNVRTLKKDDSMESFFFAETLKYAWLIFAPESAFDLDKFVFNTEAHPFRK